MVSTAADRPGSVRRSDSSPGRRSAWWPTWRVDHPVPVGPAAAITAVLAVVAVSRSPHLLTTGRFWAEEGSVWFRQMAADGGPGQLVFVNPHTGYVLSVANIGAWIAAKVPIDQAPLVPTWISFGIVLTIVWVALRWPSEVLRARWARVYAAAFVVVGTLAIAEVWLNTTNVQTYLGVLALLLLFVPVDELDRRHFVVAVALLALAMTSGLWAVSLAPLFVIAAVRQRSRRRWIVAGLAGAAAALQAGLVVRAQVAGDLAASRATEAGLSDLVGGPVRHHLMGFASGVRSIRLVDDLTSGGRLPNLVAGAVALVVVGLVGAALVRSPRRRVPLLLAGALVLVEIVVQLGSIGGVGGRYSVVPIAIIMLMALYGATMASERILRLGTTALLAWSLLWGLAGFWTEDPAKLRCQGCPDWSQEVEQWRAGDTDELQIWPYDGDHPWVIDLPPQGG